MSTSTPTTNADGGTAGGQGTGPFRRLSDGFHASSLTTPLEVAGFWSAVLLPFVYLPLLLGGLHTQRAALTFGGLLALHVLAVVAGHGHRRD